MAWLDPAIPLLMALRALDCRLKAAMKMELFSFEIPRAWMQSGSVYPDGCSLPLIHQIARRLEGDAVMPGAMADTRSSGQFLPGPTTLAIV